MTNEELVALIQSGERERMAELWAQVEKFVAKLARRRVLLAGGLGGVEFGDLYNAGYLPLVAAADSFDPAAGRSFIGWLTLGLKTAFAEAGGYRSQKQAHDPLHYAGSLDAPAGEDEDSADLGDLQADPAAAQAFEDVEAKLYREQLHAALETALAALPDNQGTALRRRFYDGQSLYEIGEAKGVSPEAVRQWQMKGLQALRRQRELQQFVEERTPYYLRVGVDEFQRTGESAVERIVIRREQLREPRPERTKLDRAQLEAQAANVGEEYVNAIEDSFIRTSFRLWCLHGWSWKEVAAVVGGGKTWAAVRDACLRYLEKHPSG